MISRWRTLKISFWNFWEQRRTQLPKLSLYKLEVDSGSSWIKDINIHLYKGLYSREIVVNDWFREADRIF